MLLGQASIQELRVYTVRIVLPVVHAHLSGTNAVQFK